MAEREDAGPEDTSATVAVDHPPPSGLKIRRPRQEGERKDGKEADQGDGKEGKPQGPPRWVLILILVAILLGGGWWGWRWWSHSRLHEVTDNAYVEAPVAMIGPRVQGQVLRVHVAENAEVAEGTPLFDLDARDFEASREAAGAALRAAEARIAQAQAQQAVAAAGIGEAQAQLAVAEAEAARAASDAARYRGLSTAAVAAQERDRAGSESRAAQARAQAARTRVASAEAQRGQAQAAQRAAEAEAAQAEARLREAELNLSHTRIVAPFPGRVTNKRVEPGDHVRPGSSVIALVGTERWVEANFKESQLTDMRPGQPVTLTVDAFPDAVMTGRIESLQRGTGSRFAALPPQNATGNWVKVVQRVPVRIALDEAWQRRAASGELPIAPGMSAEVEARVR
ncbi:HlyD family secretion protein [Pararoseomonas sp. SCSIO 73927]|uniref:HlyD family secretion protein n=1 Tax=Pararoseomonas sp. SCSIO 73927 TaxID=3114537 RepID=UPI0030D066D5